MRHTSNTLSALQRAFTLGPQFTIRPGDMVRAKPLRCDPALVPTTVPVFDVDTVTAYFDEGHANLTMLPLAWLELRPVIQEAL